MSDQKKTSGTPLDADRRKFLNSAAIVGLAGAGLSVGLASCKKAEEGAAKPAGEAGKAAPAESTAGEYGKYEVPPGKLDDYYMFSSGGHSGDVRIYGLPSGRTLKQIPVFNMDCMIGWGITNESKAVIGTRADGSVKYNTGDTHHVHGS
ncbi:MAG TPA: TAT-dependent nitrous-oxide reductase, partial [Gammaproteobacteria bacterium]|nr:TAT-dependent nitrous-oxide reductase [Gammaproteobacteria bacterium]